MDYSGHNVNICRNLIEDEIFHKPELLQLFLHGLMKASHRKQMVDVNCGRKTVKVELQPGQWIYGRETTARELGQNPFSTYRRMKVITGNLKKWHMFKHTHFTVVTIYDWESYKPKKSTGAQVRAHPSAKKSTPIKQVVKTFKTMNKEEFKKTVYESGQECGLSIPQMKNFYQYWTEPGASGMMRFQYEKTWEIKRRMETFLRNDRKYGFTKNSDEERVTVKI